MAAEPSLWASIAPSIVSAISGLSGVFLGGRLTEHREAAKEAARSKREASYLAILVVAHLDRYANGCLHVSYDDGTSEGRPAGGDGQFHQTTVKPPTFDPLSLQVDWKVLPVDLMHDILSLPYKAEQLANHLAGAHKFGDDYPEHTEFFWARRQGYAVLGLEVSALANKLRLHAGLPIENPAPGGWNRDSAMREQIEDIDSKRAAYEARLASLAKPIPQPSPSPLNP